MTAQNFTVDNGITVTGSGGDITMSGGNISNVGNLLLGNVTLVNANIASAATSFNFTSTLDLQVPGDLVSGNVYTGNISAIGNVVATVFSGGDEYAAPIILAPSLTDYANLKYMQIRAGGDDSHIHYDSGNNAQYDLYYGDDNKYVKVGNTGNITISAYSSGSSQWVFDNTGNLTTSNNTTVTTANATGGDGGHSVTIQAGASDPVTWNPNPGGNLDLRGGYGSFGDGGGGNGGHVNIVSGGSSDADPGNVYVVSGGPTWNFNNTGNLTVPGVIHPLDDGNVDLGAAGYQFRDIRAVGSVGPVNSLTIFGNSELASAGANVHLTANGTATWNFNYNGDLWMPGNTAYIGASANNLQMYSDLAETNGILFYEGGSEVYSTGDFAIFADNAGTGNTWRFYANSLMTAPGAISAVGNVTAQNLISDKVQGTSANVSLVAGSYSTVFDNIGTATFPGAVQLAVYANTTVRDSSISSPTPGMMIYVTGTGMQVRGATSWNTIADSGT